MLHLMRQDSMCLQCSEYLLLSLVSLCPGPPEVSAQRQGQWCLHGTDLVWFEAFLISFACLRLPKVLHWDLIVIGLILYTI